MAAPNQSGVAEAAKRLANAANGAGKALAAQSDGYVASLDMLRQSNDRFLAFIESLSQQTKKS